MFQFTSADIRDYNQGTSVYFCGYPFICGYHFSLLLRISVRLEILSVRGRPLSGANSVGRDAMHMCSPRPVQSAVVIFLRDCAARRAKAKLKFGQPELSLWPTSDVFFFLIVF